MWNDEAALRNARQHAKSRREMLRLLGISINSATYERLERHCARLGVDLDFEAPYRSPSRTPDEALFAENSSYLSNNVPLKERFVERSGVERVCVLCGLGSEWNGKPLILQLDHINGINNDNRLENLRLLCPNCHTQTDTYAGRGGARAAIPYHKIKQNGLRWWRERQATSRIDVIERHEEGIQP